MNDELPTIIEDQSDPVLVAALRELIATHEGAITFAQFMALVLYHPTHGYYQQASERPGRGGDFLTAPELSPFFGQCLAQQAHEVWQELGQPGDFTIVEYGSGGGRLAHDILATARATTPAFFQALQYRLHETNPHRQRNALALLSATDLADHASADTPAATTFTGMIIANEFVDALPVHRLIGGEAGSVDERLVGWEPAQQWFGWQQRPASRHLLAALAAGKIQLQPGQQAEINLAAPDWLRSAAARLQRGLLLTIDYGYQTAELYDPKRQEGTFLCYYRHTANDLPFQHLGQQDLTAHVDFGALERVGTTAGLTTLGFTTQSELLINLGLGELLVATQQPGRPLPDYLTDRNAVFALIDPGGLGKFGVLAQGKGFQPSQPLRGFRQTY